MLRGVYLELAALSIDGIRPTKERGQARLPDLETFGLARLVSR